MKGSLQKKRDKYYVVVYQKDENGNLIVDSNRNFIQGT